MKKRHFLPFRRIIVPVFSGIDNEPVIRAATAITDNDRVMAVGIVPIPNDVSLSEGVIPARELRTHLQEYIRRFLVRSRGRVIVSHDPWMELAAVAEHKKAAFMVLDYPQGLQTMGISTEVLVHPPCDLALIRAPIPANPRRILVLVRGGPYAELSLRVALSIAHTQKAHITALHITQPDTHADKNDLAFRGLEQILAKMPEVDFQTAQTNDPLATILSVVPGYDLVIMGASAQPVDSDVSLGRVTDEVLQKSPVGMMIVKTRRPMPIEVKSEVVGQNAISILVDKWFAENTYHADEFADLDALVELKRKRKTTISLALPALNEEETVGEVIHTIKKELHDRYPLLDEIILMDSNSTDRTRQIVESLGVPVYIHQHILLAHGERQGKGEALWKSLYATRGDIVIWVDTDITNIHPRFVYGLIGPLLANPKIQFVKGYYRRPIRVGEKIQAGGGGRVTELTARPLLNLFYPELSGVVQPLSGEYGGRRRALEQLPFFSGYGVEIGLLIDMFERFGLSAIAQVDLLERIHRNQDLGALSKMSFAIIQAVIRKLEKRYGQSILVDLNKTMKLICQEEGRFFLDIEDIHERERPPMIDIPEYHRKAGWRGKNEPVAD